MNEQAAAIDEAAWDVIVWLDAARADDFADLAPDPWTENAQLLYNGGFGYTGRWMVQHFHDRYDAQFYHSGQPIRSMQGTPEGYDEREHFREVIDYDEYLWSTDVGTCLPRETNRVVREHYDGGQAVIRYLAPHPPFPELVEPTRSKARIAKTTEAIRAGELEPDDVVDAYRSYYEDALEAVADLLPDLEGRVVLTSDHGELLGEEGKWYHGPDYPDVDALTEVPWAVIQDG